MQPVKRYGKSPSQTLSDVNICKEREEARKAEKQRDRETIRDHKIFSELN